MTDEKNQQSISAEVNVDKPKNRAKKISFFRVLALFFVILFSYCGFRYFEIKQAQNLGKKVEASKIDNIENEIFELAEDYKNHGADGHDALAFSDIPLSEVQEKGADFIYKMLLKNQIQINDLKAQIESLKSEFTKYKNQEKLGKIIFSYLELRQKIFAGENYDNSLKSFQLTSVFDIKLQDKAAKLEVALKSFTNAKDLNKSFSDLIPEIIVTKGNPANDDLAAKIRRNISRLVVIRRVDGKNPNNVDGIVARAEKLIRSENYQEALDCLLALDQNYHAILADFLSKLSAASEMKKIDAEILSYLKTLS